jgi:hypothetical protein
MKFLLAAKGCARLDHIRNKKIMEDLGVKPVLTQIMKYVEK